VRAAVRSALRALWLTGAVTGPLAPLAAAAAAEWGVLDSAAMDGGGRRRGGADVGGSVWAYGEGGQCYHASWLDPQGVPSCPLFLVDDGSAWESAGRYI